MITKKYEQPSFQKKKTKNKKYKKYKKQKNKKRKKTKKQKIKDTINFNKKA